MANVLKTEIFSKSDEEKQASLDSKAKKEFANSLVASIRSDTTDVDADRCAICLDRFKDGDEICTSQNKSCSHEFHRKCIFKWLLENEDCPCCRRNYLSLESVRDGKDIEEQRFR